MTTEKQIDFSKTATESLTNLIAKKETSLNLSQYLRSDSVSARIAQLVGDNSEKWISTILHVGTSSEQLRKCDPKTIVHAAIQSISLHLDIDKNLGFAHIVPYGNVAQFQMGYKGFIQLAMRSGQYKTINATEVYEGELIETNRLTGEIIFDEKQRISDKIIGYVAYFRLLNGFEKSLYMTIEQIEKHAKTYSKSFGNKNGRWQIDFKVMAMKTVLKLLLSKYGILSVDMQQAIKKDQSVIKDVEGEQIDYCDAVEINETEQ